MEKCHHEFEFLRGRHWVAVVVIVIFGADVLMLTVIK